MLEQQESELKNLNKKQPGSSPVDNFSGGLNISVKNEEEAEKD